MLDYVRFRLFLVFGTLFSLCSGIKLLKFMKKIFLSALLVAGAFTISIAQVKTEKKTTETTHVEESMSIERLSNRSSEDMTGRRVIMMNELPAQVQDAFTTNKEFKKWKVQDVMEVEATSTDPMQYELVLIPEDVQDELMDASEDLQDDAAEMVEDGAPVEQRMVSIQVPAVVLRYDAEGNLISKTEKAVDESETDKKDSGIYRDDN